MDKKYVMFIDENGFFDSENNFYMAGVIFNEDYCSGTNESSWSLRKVIEDNKLDISAAGKDINFKRGCILKTEVYNVLKYSEFSVIISKVKNEEDDIELKAFNKLIKKYYYYIIDNNGNDSGIAMEAGSEIKSFIRQQEIFNIYMDRDKIIQDGDSCSSIINKFIITSNSNEKYMYAVNVANIIRNSISFYYERGKKQKREYKYSDRMNEKIMEVIYEKVFTEEIAFDISRRNLTKKSEQLKNLEKKIHGLEEELINKENHIKYKNTEISELLEQIKVLQHQLDDATLKTNNNIIFEILPDVDISIKNMAK